MGSQSEGLRLTASSRWEAGKLYGLSRDESVRRGRGKLPKERKRAIAREYVRSLYLRYWAECQGLRVTGRDCSPTATARKITTYQGK